LTFAHASLLRTKEDILFNDAAALVIDEW